ncbi:hypothetical protein [Parafrankia sp. FMc2]|uniref:hypothetical protein n=1 Tax=Parafrankia sp. FMc2 TaxID=3233196 RepID=UPI0034D3EDFF
MAPRRPHEEGEIRSRPVIVAAAGYMSIMIISRKAGQPHQVRLTDTPDTPDTALRPHVAGPTHPPNHPAEP